ncbi:MAG TPA: hypothetical protein VGG89_07600 [Candidatus Baltobacteraceae bacterium]
MKIYEHDLRLYGLLKRCLSGDYVSPGADALTPAMRDGMLRSLPHVEVADVCSCGTENCRSFNTTHSPVVSDPVFKVRFLVNGELMVTCDARGSIFRIEWLPGEPTNPPKRCYVATGDGFKPRPHAG